MLSAPTVAELAQFTGRTEAALGDFAPEALAQATLMFAVLTKLEEYPTEPDKLQLAKYAIMEMADRLLLEQPYAETRSGPFQTETIGSYSYSKITPTARTAQQGLKTGLFWWDVALDELTVPGALLAAHGSIGVCNEEIRYTTAGPLLVNEVADEPDWPPYIRIS